MIEFFSYAFIQRAFVVGILVSLCSSLLGVSLVLRRYSMIGDGLSHVGFGALALASVLSLPPMAVTIPVVVVAAILLLRLDGHGRMGGEGAVALLAASSLAIGVVLISYVKGTNTDINNFLFGSLMDMDKFGYIFVLQILPTIIFFSALTSLFFYLGILQKVVYAMGWCLTKLMRLSGAESLSCAGNIFLGQTEAPLMVKAYIPQMTRSELMLVMTAGMATMAGGVLAAYIGMLGGGDKLMEIEFAKHLLSASVMAAPGAIAISKVIKPQTEEVDNSVEVSSEKIGKNVLDAISNGTTDGLKLAANVGAMLLVFYALIAGFNFIFGKIGDITGLDNVIAEATDGRYSNISLEFLLSYIFYPVIWLTGIDSADLPLVGRLLGEKLILTEFVGYQSLATMIQTGAFASAKSVIMATYILCGFANFASVGIQIGGIGGLAPKKRYILSEYGFRALLGASLVALMSAAIMGMFLV